MQGDDFEWDDDKAATNFANHKIRFETAMKAFGDRDACEIEDPDPDEVRYKRICYYEGRYIAIVYTERQTRVRLISARRAERYERRQYEDR